MLDRRRLIQLSALGVAAAGPAAAGPAAAAAPAPDGLKPMTGGVAPIAPTEYQARIARAQALIRQQDLRGVFLEAGPSLTYFTGINWGRGERLVGAVIPPEGTPLLVMSAFEEPSIRENLLIPGDVRVWQEDEDPLAVVSAWLRERRLDRGRIGIEETVRFIMCEALRRQLPNVQLVSGGPVVTACRARKTASEIALMQRATDITLAAYRHTIPQIRPGMSQAEIENMMLAAMAALGGQRGWALALVGEASAYPHGAKNPKVVDRNDLILMDCGCAVQRYQADVSRTFVFGAPTPEHRRVWDIVRRGQQIAFETAQIGAPAGSVDDAVRRYYESQGFGSGYRLPGLSHRTGHGIGMETHEHVYLVKGEQTPLDVGMCFSNEPGLYAPGAFGVRLEDCVYMTAQGPAWFSRPSRSIAEPV